MLLSGRVAGRVERRGPDRRLVFEYDGDYAALPRAVPLSLTMPTRQRTFDDGRVEGWMSSLLPGHPEVRAQWAARHGAASTHPFDLLARRSGSSAPGAVQFCEAAKVDEHAGSHRSKR